MIANHETAIQLHSGTWSLSIVVFVELMSLFDIKALILMGVMKTNKLAPTQTKYITIIYI